MTGRDIQTATEIAYGMYGNPYDYIDGAVDWTTHGHDSTRTRGTCDDCHGVIDELGCDCDLPPAGSGLRPRT